MELIDFCVEWNDGNELRHGIFVKRRFTNSKLHEFGGDKIFPGRLNFAKFEVEEGDGEYSVAFRTSDGDYTSVQVRKTETFSENSIFNSIEEASKDFEQDKVGYSPNKASDGFTGGKSNTTNWKVSPLEVLHADSNLFSNAEIFPDGSIEIDHSLFKHDIERSWQDVDGVCCS